MRSEDDEEFNVIRAHLSVVEGSRSEPTAEGEDWGTWDLVSLPRAGDVLELTLNEEGHVLFVERVVHSAIQHPLPRTETPHRQRKEPALRIVSRSIGRRRVVDTDRLFAFGPSVWRSFPKPAA